MKQNEAFICVRTEDFIKPSPGNVKLSCDKCLAAVVVSTDTLKLMRIRPDLPIWCVECGLDVAKAAKAAYEKGSKDADA